MILIILGVVAVIVIYLIGSYNNFIAMQTRIKEAVSGIDVQLKRRTDLIPNLLETVKGYAKHEKEVFEKVTAARTAIMSAGSIKDKVQANDQLSSALKSLFAVAEAYPELKASENFNEFQRQLEDTEDKVAYSRQFYNSTVMDYNAKVRMFPTNFIANMYGFKEYEFFEAADEEKKNIEVKF